MAAGTWKVFPQGLKRIGNSTISLSATTFKLFLAKSSSNAVSSRATLIGLGSVTNKVASTSGFHATSGEALLAEKWSTDGASGYKFDCSIVPLTALGTAIGSVMFGIIATSGGTNLLAVCSLSSAAFTVNAGSVLTISVHANGVFKISH